MHYKSCVRDLKLDTTIQVRTWIMKIKKIMILLFYIDVGLFW